MACSANREPGERGHDHSPWDARARVSRAPAATPLGRACRIARPVSGIGANIRSIDHAGIVPVLGLADVTGPVAVRIVLSRIRDVRAIVVGILPIIAIPVVIDTVGDPVVV